MDDDQQFCLRWNNHQSTLVAVFDTLLEKNTLVDCTLAAEGKFLNAHKVVLSACSPYFEALLSKHFDKHPILILKDVKFQELKAMMDYMYRGEVNISQDQLGALLKAAESLQIKGLSDNRKGETERKPAPPPAPKSPQPTSSSIPKVQGLTIEQRNRDDSREGSMSPGPRKKKRMRRKSEELDNHDASNSSESHSLPAQNIPSTLPAKMNAADVPETIETKSEILRHKQDDIVPHVPIIKEKIETHSELMLEPKSEYVEEMNEDSIEDLTLDDDDLSNMEQVDDQAGPSHGNAGEGSSQGFGGWQHMGNQSQDEVFLAAQEAVGAHRDSQVLGNVYHRCKSCNFYIMASMMFSHLEECTKKNAVGAFICLVEGCSFSTSTHRYLRRHQSRRHAHLSVGVRTTPRRLGKKPQAPNKKLKDQNKGLLEPKKIFQRPKRKVSQQLRKLPQVQTKKLQEPSEKSKISKKNLQEPSKKSKKIKKEPQAPQAMNPIQTCILNVGRCWTCGCFIKTNRKKCDYCLGLKERPAKVYTKRAKMAIIQEGGKSTGAMRKKSHKKIAVKKVKVKINPEPESNNQQERMGGRVEPPMPKLQREEYTTAPIEKKSIVSMNVEEIMNLLNVDEDSSYVSLKDVVENLGTDE